MKRLEAGGSFFNKPPSNALELISTYLAAYDLEECPQHLKSASISVSSTGRDDFSTRIELEAYGKSRSILKGNPDDKFATEASVGDN